MATAVDKICELELECASFRFASCGATARHCANDVQSSRRCSFHLQYAASRMIPCLRWLRTQRRRQSASGPTRANRATRAWTSLMPHDLAPKCQRCKLCRRIKRRTHACVSTASSAIAAAMGAPSCHRRKACLRINRRTHLCVAAAFAASEASIALPSRRRAKPSRRRLVSSTCSAPPNWRLAC